MSTAVVSPTSLGTNKNNNDNGVVGKEIGGGIGSSYHSSSNNKNNYPIHPTSRPLKTPLDPLVMQKASKYAIRVCEEMSKRSQLLRPPKNGITTTGTNPTSGSMMVATFEREEILPYLGKLLGKGGFNNVYELDRIKLLQPPPPATTNIIKSKLGRKNSMNNNNNNNPTEAADDNDNNNDATTTSKTNEIIRQKIVEEVGSSNLRLAVKFLSDDALMNPEDACNGSADLLMESKYLTALAAHPHPALIRLHGLSRSGPDGFALTHRAGFFLIIDRLYDTLDRRIDIWRELKRRKLAGKPVVGMTRPDPKKEKMDELPQYLQVLFIQRLMTGYEIVSALAHLHSLQIVFRDLKPDNVGFDYDGNVKIFDFGLAKELDPKQRLVSNPHLYNMSGGTGSRRFMAPEVSLSEPYGLSADLYSFGILLWELITLEKAFGRMTVDEHRERAVMGDERPSVKAKIPPPPQPPLLSSSNHNTTTTSTQEQMYANQQHNDSYNWMNHIDLVHLLEACWRRDPLGRPTSKDISDELKSIIQNMVQKQFPFKNQMTNHTISTRTSSTSSRRTTSTSRRQRHQQQQNQNQNSNNNNVRGTTSSSNNNGVTSENYHQNEDGSRTPRYPSVSRSNHRDGTNDENNHNNNNRQ